MVKGVSIDHASKTVILLCSETVDYVFSLAGVAYTSDVVSAVAKSIVIYADESYVEPEGERPWEFGAVDDDTLNYMMSKLGPEFEVVKFTVGEAE